MKRYFFILLTLILCGKSAAQIDLSASMGLDLKASPSLRDYINANFSSPGNLYPSFKSAVSFSGEIDYSVQKDFQLGVEYNYQTDSYNGAGGVYQISYNLHRPSILAYYVVPGEGYQFKFGGGIGYRYTSVTQQIMAIEDYSASGFGLVLRAVGNTLLSKNLYALIGVDARYDFTGPVSNSNSTLMNNSTNSKVNLNSISIGVFLGLTYKI